MAGRLGFGLLCLPSVMRSHFSFGEPVQSTSETGIRFSRKSPAVGSMKRHCPFGARIETLLKARLAVSSRWCDWAAAVGCRVPPARDTGTGSVGFTEGMPPAPAPVLVAPPPPPPAAEVDVVVWAAEAVEALTAPLPSFWLGAAVAALVGGTVTVRVLLVQVVVELAPPPLLLLLLPPLLLLLPPLLSLLPPFLLLLPPLLLPPPPAAPPKVKDWPASPVLHWAMSIALPLTTRQDPAWF